MSLDLQPLGSSGGDEYSPTAPRPALDDLAFHGTRQRWPHLERAGREVDHAWIFRHSLSCVGGLLAR